MQKCALRTDVDWSPSVIDDKTITMKQSNRFTYNIKQNMVDSRLTITKYTTYFCF